MAKGRRIELVERYLPSISDNQLVLKNYIKENVNK
jgi:hypothetical protein